MRDQYVGDVSDALKIAFLRALAGEDRKLGVAWYYAPGDDGRPDGRHLEWRNAPAWHQLDEKLHVLAELPERSVAALEQAKVWPKGTLFHREPMPSSEAREAWGQRKRIVLQEADLVFLDPDNGLGDATEKYATYLELKHLLKPKRAVIFISFPLWNLKHTAQLRRLHERLAIESKAKYIITLRTNVSVPCLKQSRRYYIPRARWFTLVDPDARLIERAQLFRDAVNQIPYVCAHLETS